MENASRALLLAGGVLISLIIISMLVLMLNSLTSYQSFKNSISQADELATFNSQFSGYNRDDVRGNELISLANMVLDYNRRLTTAGTGEFDTGSEIGYKPIEINVNIRDPQEFSISNKNNYFLDANKITYSISNSSNNEFEEVLEKIRNEKGTGIENRWPTDAITNLANGLNSIYINDKENNDGSGDDFDYYTKNMGNYGEEILKTIYNFNTCFGSNVLDVSGVSVEDLSKPATPRKVLNALNTIWRSFPLKLGGKEISSNVRNDIFTYYEYIQFKRARFKCTEMDTDPSTGRIAKMSFSFTGHFE